MAKLFPLKKSDKDEKRIDNKISLTGDKVQTRADVTGVDQTTIDPKTGEAKNVRSIQNEPTVESVAFGPPSIRRDEAEKNTARHLGEFEETADRYKEASKGAHKGIEQEQHNTEGTYLNRWQDADFARHGGKHGRLNNRDYGKTLALMREVDAHNSRPRVGDIGFDLAIAGGRVGLEGHERPRLETEETREMERSRQLDLDRKRAAQDLQAIVDRKDYDAYKEYMKQLTGLEVSDYEARQGLARHERERHMLNVIENDRELFQWYSKRFGASLFAKAVEAAKNSPVMMNILSMILMGMPGPSLEDWIYDDWTKQYAKRTGGDPTIRQRKDMQTGIEATGQKWAQDRSRAESKMSGKFK